MQKHLFLVITIVIAGLSSRAQVKKGNWLLGSSFSYTHSSSKYDMSAYNTSQYTGAVELLPGLAVADKTVIGIRAGFAFAGNKQTGGKSTAFGFLPGVYWNQYFPCNEKLGFYTHVEAGYDKVTSKNTAAFPDKYTATGYDAGVTPAFYFKATKKMLINAAIGSLQYVHSKGDDSEHTTKSSFSTTFLNQFTFGIDFILGKS